MTIGRKLGSVAVVAAMALLTGQPGTAAPASPAHTGQHHRPAPTDPKASKPSQLRRALAQAQGRAVPNELLYDTLKEGDDEGSGEAPNLNALCLTDC